MLDKNQAVKQSLLVFNFVNHTLVVNSGFVEVVE